MLLRSLLSTAVVVAVVAAVAVVAVIAVIAVAVVAVVAIYSGEWLVLLIGKLSKLAVQLNQE